MPILEDKMVQVGALRKFPIDSVPDGWIKCNGSPLSRIAYAGLFAYLGTLYGAGDGSTTFLIPDYRGCFLRGLDNSRGLDPGRTISAPRQDDAFQGHGHEFANWYTSAAGNFDGIPGRGNTTKYSMATVSTPVPFNVSPIRYGDETRPVNMSIIICIKY
jgi:microcystin-dependent protein